MRILHFNYEFPPLGGGSGNQSYFQLMEHAKYEDLEIDLVTSSIGAYRTEQVNDRVRVFYLDINKGAEIHNQTNRELLTYSLKAYVFAKKLMAQRKYDVVHSHFGIPCGFIAQKLGLPSVITLCGSDVPGFNPKYDLLDKLLFTRVSRKVWRETDTVVALSEGFRDLARKTAPDQSFTIIPNGVDTTIFSPAPTAPDTFTVISTSRLIKRKGIHMLIEGFARFHRKFPESKLLLVGDGLERSALEAQARNERLTTVQFLGSREHDELPGLLQKADVFALPTTNEGMSNALLEALATGLAVITTNVGGTSELVTEDNGIVLPKRNATAIERALTDLYTNRQRLASMKRASRARSAQFSWESNARQYYEIYKRLVEST